MPSIHLSEDMAKAINVGIKTSPDSFASKFGGEWGFGNSTIDAMFPNLPKFYNVEVSGFAFPICKQSGHAIPAVVMSLRQDGRFEFKLESYYSISWWGGGLEFETRTFTEEVQDSDTLEWYDEEYSEQWAIIDPNLCIGFVIRKLKVDLYFGLEDGQYVFNKVVFKCAKRLNNYSDFDLDFRQSPKICIQDSVFLTENMEIVDFTDPLHPRLLQGASCPEDAVRFFIEFGSGNEPETRKVNGRYDSQKHDWVYEDKTQTKAEWLRQDIKEFSRRWAGFNYVVKNHNRAYDETGIDEILARTTNLADAEFIAAQQEFGIVLRVNDGRIAEHRHVEERKIFVKGKAYDAEYGYDELVADGYKIAESYSHRHEYNGAHNSHVSDDVSLSVTFELPGGVQWTYDRMMEDSFERISAKAKERHGSVTGQPHNRYDYSW